MYAWDYSDMFTFLRFGKNSDNKKTETMAAEGQIFALLTLFKNRSDLAFGGKGIITHAVTLHFKLH